MLKRKITSILLNRLKTYPAVALLGPRQSGKTTLAKSLGGRYFDLEQKADRLRLDVDWPEIVAGNELTILDEAQTWPEVFPRLRGEIDLKRKKNGRFLLLGSVSPSLMSQVSESLAGRLSLVELTPFFWSELKASGRQKLWIYGGFPDGGVLGGNKFPTWQHDYLNLLTRRDLPNWGLVASPQKISSLLNMLAIAHGREWNANQIGKSLALSYHTVNSYLEYLEGAFLIFRLPAYHANMKKRLIKRPKIYWRDSGLLHALLNIQDRKSLLSWPWVGNSWEGFVICQILAALQSIGKIFNAYHFRTNDQYEIDLLVEIGSELWAFEIKLTSNPSPYHLKKLNNNADLVGASRRFLICQQKKIIKNKSQMICNLENLMKFFYSLKKLKL